MSSTFIIFVLAGLAILLWDASYRIPAARLERKHEEERMRIQATRRGV